MREDKSWTLLANFLDQSAMRDKVALDLGRRRRAASPGRRTAGSSSCSSTTSTRRLPDDRVGQDRRRPRQCEPGDRHDHGDRRQLGLRLQLDFMSTLGKIVFAFKDPDERKTLTAGRRRRRPRGRHSAKLTAVKNRINVFESKLYSRRPATSTSDLHRRQAAMDFNLIKEFTKDNDSDFYSSHYFSWDPVVNANKRADNKFHFGPAWDFDRSAGNVDPDRPDTSTLVSRPDGTARHGHPERQRPRNYSRPSGSPSCSRTPAAYRPARSKARWDVGQGRVQEDRRLRGGRP